MENFPFILLIIGLFFLIVILPGTLFYFKKHNSELGRNILKELKEDEDFDVAHIVDGFNNSFYVAIDYDRNKVAYIEDDYRLVLKFDDIIAAHVLSKGEVEELKASSSITDRALIGKNLLLNCNEVIKDKHEEKLYPSILLHLSLSLEKTPDIYINCFDYKDHTVTPSRSKLLMYKNGMALATNLASLFNYISTTKNKREQKKQ